jgi:hypothetical protein
VSGGSSYYNWSLQYSIVVVLRSKRIIKYDSSSVAKVLIIIFCPKGGNLICTPATDLQGRYDVTHNKVAFFLFQYVGRVSQSFVCMYGSIYLNAYDTVQVLE